MSSGQKKITNDPVLERYKPTMGLEVHCQLNTKAKLFCRCSTAFGALPNHHTCPTCLGLPGVLPVLNREAVNYGIRLALAIGADIHEVSVFSRKQYFYPDLPKGYQITQFDLPYCTGGKVVLGSGKTVRVHRIHLEEDAGKNVHGESSSYVDLNRAGVPLLEIVSEPDIETPEDAAEYLKRLRSLVRHLGICDGNLEEGSFRVDVNVSIRPIGTKELGTRCEIKNLNSFRNIEKAIRYEIVRQSDILDAGGKIVRQTMMYDATTGHTSAMRSKEDSQDYRYFPEPDLGPLRITERRLAEVRDKLPELPEQMAQRFVSSFGLSPYDAAVLTSDKDLADFYEKVVARVGAHAPAKISANWVTSEFLREVNNREWDLRCPGVSAEDLADLIVLIGKGTISGKIAKTVFEEMVLGGGVPEKIVKEKGLIQISDTSHIEKIVEEVIVEFASQVAEYRSGKTKVFGFLVGQVMQKSQGKSNPGIANTILRQKLDG